MEKGIRDLEGELVSLYVSMAYSIRKDEKVKSKKNHIWIVFLAISLLMIWGVANTDRIDI